MSVMLSGLTIAAILLILYTYLLFPLLLLIRARLFPKPWKTGEFNPSLTLIIIVHNEEEEIEAKLDSVMALDYPSELLNVIVGSDGSDDKTEQIVRDYKDPRVQLFSFPRRGKIPALNDAVEQASTELLVFTDANSQFEVSALKKLTRHFYDESIGCVAGNQVYTDNPAGGAAAEGEQAYWDLDRVLKLAQTQAGNATSATGAIYAIRRDLVQPVPSGVTDDFTISTRAISQGYRLVFDPEAIASEAVAGKPKSEYRRKVRVMTRGLRAVWVNRVLLNPFRFGFYSLQLFTHKVLRRLIVLPLLFLLLLTPWMILQDWPLKTLAIVQWVVYAAALIGWMFSDSAIGKLKPIRISYFFVLVNAAAFMAFCNVVSGRKIDIWNPVRNLEESVTRNSKIAE